MPNALKGHSCTIFYGNNSKLGNLLQSPTPLSTSNVCIQDVADSFNSSASGDIKILTSGDIIIFANSLNPA